MLLTHPGEKLPQEAPGLRRSPGAHLSIHPGGDVREGGGGPATHPGGWALCSRGAAGDTWSMWLAHMSVTGVDRTDAAGMDSCGWRGQMQPVWTDVAGVYK